MTGLNILLMIIAWLGKFYIYIILLRFLLQMVRADFYNPICQFIVKVTHPLLKPIRKIVPSIGRQDFSSIILAFLVQLIIVTLSFLLKGQNIIIAFGSILIISLITLLAIFVDLLFLILVGNAILSWIAPDSRAPAATLIKQISNFILAPLRRIIPPIGIIDITPLIAIMLLFFIINIISQLIA